MMEVFLMKIKILLSIILVLLFSGLLVFVNNYNNQQSNVQENKPRYFKVEAQEDLILDGVVKARKVQELEDAEMSRLLVVNGQHVTKWQQIYNTGYVAPIDGTFTVDENKKFAIISDEQYILSSFSELDNVLINQDMEVTVKSLDGSQAFQSHISWVGLLPREGGEDVSRYGFEIQSNGLHIGQHFNIYVKYKEVVIPEKYISSGFLYMKKPDAKAWEKFKPSLVQRGGVYYAPLSEVPVGTLLKEHKS